METAASSPAPGRGSSLRNLAALLAAAIAAAAIYGFVYYRNQLVALDVAIDTQWRQVDNQLARQHELLPKLVSVTQGYAAHEAGLLARVAEARSRYRQASNRARPAAASGIDRALVDVMALAEAYPELKADRQFRDLAFEIAGTKNRIALERQRYNEQVGLLNARLRQLPWKLTAAGLEPRPFYEFDPERLIEPEIAF